MIETPEIVTQTPAASPDVLSDLLGDMRLSGTVLFRAEFHEPWAVVTPASCSLADGLHLDAEHVIPFHIVAEGGCWLELPGHPPVWLSAGDAILIPGGESHRLSGEESIEAVDIGQLLHTAPARQPLALRHGGSGKATIVICGFVQCDEWRFHPVLQHLPNLLHVSSAANPGDEWLAGTIRHTAAESARWQPGSRSMLRRLTEIMFVEIMRRHMQRLTAAEVGWLAAFRDPIAGAALTRLHAAPCASWTIESLATAIGTSRTILTARFHHFLGQPPMAYLTRWRMHLAAQRLMRSNEPLKVIAGESGYESEAAFSRAFKRHFDKSPRDWQREKRGSGETRLALDLQKKTAPR